MEELILKWEWEVCGEKHPPELKSGKRFMQFYSPNSQKTLSETSGCLQFVSLTISSELPSQCSVAAPRYGNPCCTHVNRSCSAKKDRQRPLGVSAGHFEQQPVTKMRVALGIMFFLLLSNSESINTYQLLYILSKNICSIKNKTIC